jgi:hypothetical protein
MIIRAHTMTTKLYCYVDETNPGDAMRHFIVGMVIADDNRDNLAELCREFEVEAGKRKKWSDCRDAVNIAYMSIAIGAPQLSGRLFYAVFSGHADYLAYAADAIKAAVEAFNAMDALTTVMYDALPHSLEQPLKRLLRQRGVRVNKVRGPRKEQNEPLLMLADAICGLARDTQLGKQDAMKLMSMATRTGAVREVK